MGYATGLIIFIIKRLQNSLIQVTVDGAKEFVEKESEMLV
jgi:hypothetical protein